MSTMQRYYWQGIDCNGKQQHGWMLAAERHQLRQYLLARQIVLQQAIALPKPLEQLLHPGQTRIEPTQITNILRELAILLDAGVPMLQALEMLAEQAQHTAMRHLLGRIRERVAGGMPLSTAMAGEPTQFNPLLTALVRAGESSGQLTPLLQQIARHRQETARLQGNIRRALFYPSIVLAIAVVVTLALMIWVVPRFEALFADFGAELPAFTQAVIALSDQLRATGWMLLGASVLVSITLGVLPRYSERLALWIDRVWLHTPITGRLIQRAEIARFAGTLAMMIRAGIPLTEALSRIAPTLHNRCYREAISVLHDGIHDGHSVAHAIRLARRFPASLAQLVAVGEASGELERMLEHIASREEQALNEAVTSLASRIEPVVMSLLGLLVGGLVLAMYLPVFQLGNAI